MANDDDDRDDHDGSDDVPEAEVRDALRVLRSGSGSLKHVITLVNAAPQYATALVPDDVIQAVAAKFEMDRDVANGGLDQFAWNHGVSTTRAVAAVLRTIGAIENADVLDTLATAIEHHKADVGKTAIAADPVKHFLAYRRAVNGPEFGIPDHDEEIGEALVEFVIEHAAALPDPDRPLVAASK
jgi:hypothetical protein